MNSFSASRPVHVVVLAAGRGSRLGALGDSTPKWLLEVGERTLADRHLEGIELAGAAVAGALVVTGHAAEAIDAELSSRGDRVVPVRNAKWASRNNWWSLLRALQELPREAPVVVINADLLIDPEHVAAFLIEAAETDADALIAVDLDRELTDESMKVERGPDGTLSRIGKVGISNGVGEYPGLLMARGGVVEALRATLEGFVDRDECVDEWYEGAVGRTAADGHPWHIWAMPAGGWVEIDDDADLDQARDLVEAA